MNVTSTLGPNVGWEAGGYVGSYVQWCAEHPKATAVQRERIAVMLLACADRAEWAERPKDRRR